MVYTLRVCKSRVRSLPFPVDTRLGVAGTLRVTDRRWPIRWADLSERGIVMSAPCADCKTNPVYLDGRCHECYWAARRTAIAADVATLRCTICKRSVRPVTHGECQNCAYARTGLWLDEAGWRAHDDVVRLRNGAARPTAGTPGTTTPHMRGEVSDVPKKANGHRSAASAPTARPRRPSHRVSWAVVAATALVISLMLATAILNASGQRQTASATPSATPVATTTPAPTERLRSSEVPTDRPNPRRTTKPPTPKPAAVISASASDAVGDVRAPTYADLTALSVESSATTLVLRMDLAGAPRGLAAGEVVYYMFHIDVDGDGSEDYWVDMENDEAGRFFPVITDLADGTSRSSYAFPGSGRVAGTGVLIRVDAEALGSPTRIGVNALVQRSVDFDVRSEDTAPEGRREWLRVGG